MRLFLLLSFISLFLSINCQAQQFDTLWIHFDNNKYLLDQKEQDLVDRFLEGRLGGKFLVYGLSDYIGESANNLELSQNRSQTVAKYLQSRGIKSNQLLVIKGLGQSLERSATETSGNSAKRIVMLLCKSGTIINPSQSSITSTVPKAELDMEALIQATPEQGTFVLKDIYFVQHKVDLMPVSMKSIEELLTVLQKNPNLKISIEGHICCNQADGYDPNTASYKLSILRAKKIFDYLVLNKIAADRLQYNGFGRTRPIYQNETSAAEMDANRRVEIRILTK